MRSSQLRAGQFAAILGLVTAGLASCSVLPLASDNEKIAAAADHVAKTDSSVQLIGPEGFEYPDVLPYSDGADLMANNPGCCGFGILKAGDAAVPSCWTPGHQIVTVSYKKRYFGKDGTVLFYPGLEYVGVRPDGTTCGWD